MREKGFLVGIFCLILLVHGLVLQQSSDSSRPAFFSNKLFILANFRGFLFPWLIDQSGRFGADGVQDQQPESILASPANRDHGMSQPSTRATHFVFHPHSGASHSILIHSARLGGKRLQPYDEIGVFTLAGVCVGATVFSGTLPIQLIAWLDHPATLQKDGYQVGERMFFSIWDHDKKKEYIAHPRYLGGDSTFTGSVCSQISRLESDRPQPQGRLTLQSVCRSPDGTARLSIHLPQDGIVNLALYDVKNQRVNGSLQEYKKRGRHTVLWHTTGSANGIYVCRLETAHTVKNLKLALVN